MNEYKGVIIAVKKIDGKNIGSYYKQIMLFGISVL